MGITLQRRVEEHNKKTGYAQIRKTGNETKPWEFYDVSGVKVGNPYSNENLRNYFRYGA